MMQHHHAQDASLFNGYVENLLGLAASSGGHASSGHVHTAMAKFSPASAHRHRDSSHLMRAKRHHSAPLTPPPPHRERHKASGTAAVATTSICHNPSRSSAQEAARIALAERGREVS